MNPNEHAQALATISALVRKHPTALIPVLPMLVESVVRSLDPHVPYLRNACLKPATSLVHELVRRYPMIAFHQQSQRLAVGTQETEGQGEAIYIYDLISATRWYTLEGHKSSVAAVAFSNDGKEIASYAVDDAQVKLWKTSSSFFGILGSNTSCYKTIKVSSAARAISPLTLLEGVKLQWLASKKLVLLRSWEDGDNNYVIFRL